MKLLMPQSALIQSLLRLAICRISNASGEPRLAIIQVYLCIDTIARPDLQLHDQVAQGPSKLLRESAYLMTDFVMTKAQELSRL